MSLPTKQCTKCKIVKEVSNFSLDSSRADKLNPNCKQCTSARHQKRKERYILTRTATPEKYCSACKLVKPSSEFYKSTGSKTGLCSECKNCQKTRNQKIYESDKERILQKNKEYHAKNAKHITSTAFIRTIKRKYGISYKEYMEIKENQNFKCKICKVEESKLPVRLNLDHCHSTGKIRGFLCGKCNTGLGIFNDDIELFLTAIEYIKQNRNNHG